jgi:hypothetical protein
MINSTGLDGDGENGQSIARSCGFLGQCVAIGPDDCSDCRCPTYTYRITRDSLREFTIDVDNAIWAIGGRGVSCPTTTIIGSQLRRRRTIELTEHDGKCSNWRARNSLCSVAAACYHNHCQQKKQENTHEFD